MPVVVVVVVVVVVAMVVVAVAVAFAAAEGPNFFLASNVPLSAVFLRSLRLLFVVGRLHDTPTLHQ